MAHACEQCSMRARPSIATRLLIALITLIPAGAAFPPADASAGHAPPVAPSGSPEAGANLRATSVIWEWIRPKTRAVVWPPAFATHPIVFPASSGSR